MAQAILRHIRNVAGDDLWAELGLANLNVIILDVDTGQAVVLHQAAAEDNRVLHVVTAPRHKGHRQVSSQRDLALGNRRTLDEDVALLDPIATGYPNLLVVAAIVIVLDEVSQCVDLDAISILDMNFISISPHHFAISLGLDQVAAILGHRLLDTGTDNRWLWREQRHCLTLHV